MPKKRACSMRNATIPEGACSFCRTSEVNPILGELIEKQNIKFHLNCMFAASGLSQDKEEERTDEKYVSGFHIDDILKEVRRGRPLVCNYCRCYGACVGCTVGSCPVSFHLPCVTKAGGMTIFEDLFPTYCRRHVPKQDVDKWFKLCNSEAPTCCICLFPIISDTKTETNSKPSVIVAPRRSSTPVLPDNKNRRLSRRSCVTVLTPKRIRVSLCDVKTVSPSNSKDSWEISNTISSDNETQDVSQTEVNSTLTPKLSSSVEPSLRDLPNWLKLHLSNIPISQQSSVYDTWLHDTIHGSCCPKAWMHRSCIAGYAVTAALHYLKCPYCADKTVFIPTVIAAGIWVPDRDAAWELEPGAFADMVPTEECATSVSWDGNSSQQTGTTRSDSSSSSDSPQWDAMATTPTTNSTRGATARRSVRRSMRLHTPTTRQPLSNATNVRQLTETADSPQKAVLSLVWNNRPFDPRRRGNSRGRPRRLTTTTVQKSPETDNRLDSSNRRHLSLFPRHESTVMYPSINAQISENHRLRQVTLGSFLANFRVSSHN